MHRRAGRAASQREREARRGAHAAGPRTKLVLFGIGVMKWNPRPLAAVNAIVVNPALRAICSPSGDHAGELMQTPFGRVVR